LYFAKVTKIIKITTQYNWLIKMFIVEWWNTTCKTLIIIICGSCLFGGCIYNLDSPVGVIPILVLPICSQFSSYQYIGNTSIGIIPTRLSSLYRQPPNKQLPHVTVIKVLQIIFYHSAVNTWKF